MRFLPDQDVYAVTTRFLKSLGHDVVTASEAGCSRSTDLELLSMAQKEGRVLVARDRDFGKERWQSPAKPTARHVSSLP